ncbi:cell division protein FtsQ/DivIB [Sphingomonas sp. MMS24-JH45]
MWQANGQLTLIDAEGRLLAPVDARRTCPTCRSLRPGRGPGRKRAIRRCSPPRRALKPRIRAASWIGNRRWDLTFDTGETLALPQDDPARALVKFAELDGAKPLLGKGWLRFDLRDPTKLVARRPGEGAGEGTGQETGLAADTGGDTTKTPGTHRRSGMGMPPRRAWRRKAGDGRCAGTRRTSSPRSTSDRARFPR